MTIDERRIAEELRHLADDATPVDPLALAARTLARRRRRARSVTGVAVLAVAATAVAVLVVPSSNGLGPDSAARVATLPDNTPEQSRLVRECMPQGGPAHSMDGDLRIAGQGSVDDFRVLVDYRDEGGSTALVGSEAGFVLCTPTAQKDMADRPVLTYWGFKAPGDLDGFSGDLQVDAYTAVRHPYTVGERQTQKEDIYQVVAGRVSDAVERVEIDWADGRRTPARIASGFFIVRIAAKVRREPDKTSGEVLLVSVPSATVTAYGADGRVLEEEENVVFGPVNRGD
ncbi:hypothetical protein GCM10022224_043180 [Nonomuraea antimicrobica]|uniref:DUF3179 domain-containing protein n=1 Tax=Nonomuraea antimicrobica TaxID=561173 RepID=A0ABP7C1G8_9ACTN